MSKTSTKWCINFCNINFENFKTQIKKSKSLLVTIQVLKCLSQCMVQCNLDIYRYNRQVHSHVNVFYFVHFTISFTSILVILNPLSPRIIIQILLTSLYTFSWGLVRRTCLNIKINSSLVIIYLILMTCMCYKRLISWGEIWCWSLLGLKGLTIYPHNSC